MITTLSDERLAILEAIKGRIVYGDVTKIAVRCKLSREHVSRVLSVTTDNYNEDVVNAAVKIINDRQKKEKKFRQSLPL